MKTTEETKCRIILATCWIPGFGILTEVYLATFLDSNYLSDWGEHPIRSILSSLYHLFAVVAIAWLIT